MSMSSECRKKIHFNRIIDLFACRFEASALVLRRGYILIIYVGVFLFRWRSMSLAKPMNRE